MIWEIILLYPAFSSDCSPSGIPTVRESLAWRAIVSVMRILSSSHRSRRRSWTHPDTIEALMLVS